MKIPVLTYHSTNINGNDYCNNDHIAFQQDIELIKKLGIRVLPAHDLARWIRGEMQLSDSDKYVVLTFDDGCQLDYYDWEHPVHGFQTAFFSIMQKSGIKIHATSFVIASYQVRKQLEQTCFLGHEIWGEEWWNPAERSGLISVENHSWDHLHVTLETVKQIDNIKGDFSKIETVDDADAQIKQSSDYINSRLNKKVSLFAYPYGHYNSYLVDEYFPGRQNEIIAAFTCDAHHVTVETNIWKIPRFVCGDSWRNSSELQEILLKE